MKNLIVSLVGILLIYLLVVCSIVSCERIIGQTTRSDKDSRKEHSIQIYSTPELRELTSTWVREFCLMNPDAKIKVTNISENAFPGYFENSSNLVFTSFESETIGQSNWQEVIGRDVIVPVVSSKNPVISEIMMQGISVEMLAQIISDPASRDWSLLLNSDQNIPFNLYMTPEASSNASLKKFLEVDQINLEGIKVKGGNNLMVAIDSDPYAVGICKVKNIIDFNNNRMLSDVKVLPLDKNKDGGIDHVENIYSNLSALLRGVWIGKYPRVLTNNIYAISPVRPTNKTEVAFLKWVLTDGQQYLNNYGYVDLWNTQRLAKVDLLDDFKTDLAAVDGYPLTKKSLFYYVYLPIIVVLSLALVYLVIRGIQYLRGAEVRIVDPSLEPKFVFNEEVVRSPQGLYYDKTHTWAFMEKSGMVTIGVDDFLQHITGPITGIKMKHPGERIKKGKKIVSIIQAGKQLDIYAPFSGIIKERNAGLDSDTSMINSSPYEDGWIYRIEPTNWIKELQFFISGGKYKEWLRGEFSRLKEFFENSVRTEKVAYAHVLQDGGELKDSILLEFGPEVWEDFQTSFLDVSI